MSKGKLPPVDLSSFSDLASELVEMMVSVACDIALIVDDSGVIQKVAVGSQRPAPADAQEWIGQRLADTVTEEMRGKVAQFLGDLTDTGVSRVRHLNHASDDGPEIPMAYSAIRLGNHGPTLAVGRDMRLVAAMQDRLMQTQRTIERDYWKRRSTETDPAQQLVALADRSGEAIAVCDLSGRLQFANAAFLRLAEVPAGESAVGKNIADWLSDGGVSEILGLINNAEQARLFKAAFMRAKDASIVVEMSATLLPALESVGLIIRVCHSQEGAAGRSVSDRDFH